MPFCLPIPCRIAARGMDAPRIQADSHARPYRQPPGRNTGPSTPECGPLTDGRGRGSAWGPWREEKEGAGPDLPGRWPTTQALAHPLAFPQLHARSRADCFRLLMRALRHSREVL